MKINVHKKEFQNFNCLVAIAGSNCPQGGDAGHGGRTVIAFEDMGGTALDVVVEDELGNETKINNATKVKLVFAGDSEFQTSIQALEFMLAALKGDKQVLQEATKTKVEVD